MSAMPQSWGAFSQPSAVTPCASLRGRMHKPAERVSRTSRPRKSDSNAMSAHRKVSLPSRGAARFFWLRILHAMSATCGARPAGGFAPRFARGPSGSLFARRGYAIHMVGNRCEREADSDSCGITFVCSAVLSLSTPSSTPVFLVSIRVWGYSCISSTRFDTIIPIIQSLYIQMNSIRVVVVCRLGVWIDSLLLCP